MNPSIHNKAMLVGLSISTWTARKYDKKVTQEVDRQNNATDAGRYTKHLLPADAPTYQAVMQTATAARTFHYAHTLPWSDEGERLLPTAEFTEYSDAMRRFRQAFDTALADFLSDYPSLQQTAQARLNGLYNDSDYPNTDQLARKFSFSTRFSPLPAEGDFRLDLPAGTLQELEAQTQTRIQTAVADSMKDAWNRLYEAVSHIQTKLAEPGAIFRDSLIGNAAELCELLTRLNVTNDAALEAMRARVQAELATVNPAALRNNAQARQQTAQAAADIMAAMSQVYKP